MSQIYAVDLGAIGKQNRPTPEDRLSQRAAILAIVVVSLLFWTPMLLPLVTLLHR
jgi:hypothetical protein